MSLCDDCIRKHDCEFSSDEVIDCSPREQTEEEKTLNKRR
jgi:hypothetical protein